MCEERYFLSFRLEGSMQNIFGILGFQVAENNKTKSEEGIGRLEIMALRLGGYVNVGIHESWCCEEMH